MSELGPKPLLLSDFDGTAVRKYTWRNPRNWAKYPLPEIPGYLGFIAGVEEEGVDFGGIVSIRKKFWRQRVTDRSLRRLGYSSVIRPDMVEYAGKEDAKGRFVAEQSRERTVGMIDDKVHRVGLAIVNSFAEGEVQGGNSSVIILGAVAHERNQEDMTKLVEASQGFGSQVEVLSSVGIPIQIVGEDFRMDVVQLPAYSNEAGRQFAERLWRG